ncbi:MAG: FAD-dependent thymidylate synthase [Prevotellaceae bacterium]|jgi:thymidylate synthase ThyX|nr:FAD-dependent thymidylate synthase [Prevotellaceae bacterium]
MNNVATNSTDSKTEFAGDVFTDEERLVLQKYFTNIDKPVFGLINMSEVVKGALFARYSRSGKSLRRLFLDEFYSGNIETVASENIQNEGIRRASSLYDKMILDFGDDSVAQLGGAHIACEQVSNILTKTLEKGRLAAYLEQSTRYIYYNEKVNGKYRYVVPSEIRGSRYESLYCNHIDSLFDTYTEILKKIVPLLEAKYPASANMSERAWKSTIKAKACDIVRGLLPAATKSNLGIYANGQTFEYLLIKMYASKNPETVEYADMMLAELRKIIPSFLTRVDLEDRGRLWSKYLGDIAENMNKESAKLFDGNNCSPKQEINEIQLTEWDGNALERVLQSILFEYSSESGETVKNRLVGMSEADRLNILLKYCGERGNRRHKPGRAFESTGYRFEILSDYGAFRDLQRHRMLTVTWQKLSPNNGYTIPVELEEYPDIKSLYENALIRSADIYATLQTNFGDDTAQYAVPFSYRVRYEISMNLREAFHLIELRSQKQGHYSYRKIAIEMYNLIACKAGHKFFADCMKFIDPNFYDLAREDAERLKDIKV